MNRRKFLVGVSGTAIGGSALLGSGAFSRVESQRDVTIAVAEDPDAYLGMSVIEESLNSLNYVSLDEKGHIAIDVGDSGNGGFGVNSDSFTWFDNMVRICNQGKEAVGFYIEEPTDDDFPSGIDATGPAPYDDEPRLQFYTGEAAGVGDDGTSSVMGEANAVDIAVGECIELGVRTMTKGVNANDGTLFGDEIRLIADVDTSIGSEEPPELGDPSNPFEIPVREFGEDPNQNQFNALEEIELTDPFELHVESSALAGEESTEYGVTAFYGVFGEAPSDRLFGPTVPLDFDDDGKASVTIGSAGTGADVTTGFAPGALSGDVTLVNNIETPEGTDAVFVAEPETMSPASFGIQSMTGGGFTEVEENR